MDKFTFEIMKHLGALSAGNVVTELNIVKWGGNEGTYDLRRWKPGIDGEEKTPYKGITLTANELQVLKDILNSIEI